MPNGLRIFLIFEIFYRFCPHFLIAPLYYQQILGSYVLAMAVFSTILVSCSISEIPMGILSDFIGRKKTIIIASLGNFLSLFLFIVADILTNSSHILVFVAAVIMGLSQALYSGTLEAFMYESIYQKGQISRYNEYYSRIKGAGAASSAISTLLSGILICYYPYIICFWFSGIMAIITIIISCFYQDIGHKKKVVSLAATQRHLKDIYKVYIHNPKLCWISLAKILGDEVSYRVEVVYAKTLIPDYMLGIPRMLKNIFECISYIYTPYLIHKFKPIGALITTNSWMIGIRGLAVGINNMLSPFIMSMVDLLYGTTVTAFSGLLQNEYNNKQRATMESLINMASTIWTSLLLLLIGMIIDYTNIRFALIVFIAYRFTRYFCYYKILKIDTSTAKQKTVN